MADKPNEPKPNEHKASPATPTAGLDTASIVNALGLLTPTPEEADRQFRRQAFLAVLSAYVSRHGAFNPADAGVHARNCWECVDIALALEDAGPNPRDVPSYAVVPPAVPKSKRPVHPSDEWAVLHQGKRNRGFGTEDEARVFAANRPGAEVVQIGGPELMAVSSTM